MIGKNVKRSNVTYFAPEERSLFDFSKKRKVNDGSADAGGDGGASKSGAPSAAASPRNSGDSASPSPVVVVDESKSSSSSGSSTNAASTSAASSSAASSSSSSGLAMAGAGASANADTTALQKITAPAEELTSKDSGTVTKSIVLATNQGSSSTTGSQGAQHAKSTDIVHLPPHIHLPLGIYTFPILCLRTIRAHEQFSIDNSMGPALRPKQRLQIDYSLSGFKTKEQKIWSQKYNQDMSLCPPNWLQEYADVRLSIPNGVGEIGVIPGPIARTLLPLIFWGCLVVEEARLPSVEDDGQGGEDEEWGMDLGNNLILGGDDESDSDEDDSDGNEDETSDPEWSDSAEFANDEDRIRKLRKRRKLLQKRPLLKDVRQEKGYSTLRKAPVMKTLQFPKATSVSSRLPVILKLAVSANAFRYKFFFSSGANGANGSSSSSSNPNHEQHQLESLMTSPGRGDSKKKFSLSAHTYDESDFALVQEITRGCWARLLGTGMVKLDKQGELLGEGMAEKEGQSSASGSGADSGPASKNTSKNSASNAASNASQAEKSVISIGSSSNDKSWVQKEGPKDDIIEITDSEGDEDEEGCEKNILSQNKAGMGKGIGMSSSSQTQNDGFDSKTQDEGFVETEGDEGGAGLMDNVFDDEDEVDGGRGKDAVDSTANTSSKNDSTTAAPSKHLAVLEKQYLPFFNPDLGLFPGFGTLQNYQRQGIAFLWSRENPTQTWDEFPEIFLIDAPAGGGVMGIGAAGAAAADVNASASSSSVLPGSQQTAQEGDDVINLDSDSDSGAENNMQVEKELPSVPASNQQLQPISRSPRLSISAPPVIPNPPKTRVLNPCWSVYRLPSLRALAGLSGPLISRNNNLKPGSLDSNTNPRDKLYFHPGTGELRLDFPDISETSCRGGILADEMGLGKTIQMLGLMSTDFYKQLGGGGSSSVNDNIQSKDSRLSSSDANAKGCATLVVCPLSLLNQWVSELKKFAPSLSYVEYYGADRHRKMAEAFPEVFDEDHLQSGGLNEKGNTKAPPKIGNTKTKGGKATAKAGAKAKAAGGLAGGAAGVTKTGGKVPKAKGKAAAKKKANPGVQKLNLEMFMKKPAGGVGGSSSSSGIGGAKAAGVSSSSTSSTALFPANRPNTSAAATAPASSSSADLILQRGKKFPDVVFTTYGTLGVEKTLTQLKENKDKQGSSSLNASSNASDKSSFLFRMRWRRVVLDEAQYIKGRNTRIAKKACHLQASHRWCITGTPMQNSVEEIYPLLRFLRADPFSTPSVWRKLVSDPLEEAKKRAERLAELNGLKRGAAGLTGGGVAEGAQEQEGETGDDAGKTVMMPAANVEKNPGQDKAVTKVIHLVRSICGPILIRRTKQTQQRLADGSLAPLIQLPERIDTVDWIKLRFDASDPDGAAYKRLQFASQKKLNVLLNMQGENSAGSRKISSFTSILALIMKLRMCLCHPSLALKELKEAEKISDVGVLANAADAGQNQTDLEASTSAECPVCGDVPEDPVVCGCTHTFCRECVLALVNDFEREGDDESGMGNSAPKPFNCPSCKKQTSVKLGVDNGSSSSTAVADNKTAAAPLINGISFGSRLQAGGAQAGVLRPSAKMVMLLENLKHDFANNRSVLVFSQWTCYLSILLGYLLQQEFIQNDQVAILDGSMNTVQRQKCTTWFGEKYVNKNKSAKKVGGDDSNIAAGNNRARANSDSSAGGPGNLDAFGMSPRNSSQSRGHGDTGSKANINNPSPKPKRIISPLSKRNKHMITGADASLTKIQSSSSKVLLISLKAGGVGLNLTTATKVYLTDLWWNPAVEEQAFQRAHRIGQTSSVECVKLVCKDTIDERILALQAKKRMLIGGALGEKMDGVGEGGSKLTLEELKGLLA